MDPVRYLRAQVARALDRATDLPAHGGWLVGCSGGPDSTALLDALEGLGRRSLHVVAVDHGLRPEAAKEAAQVVERAAARGLSARVLTLTGVGRSMAAARQARYRALLAEAARVGASALVVGHTASDQAETLLDRLVRGAGTRGLSAMAPMRRLDAAVWLVRPLLAVTRPEVEAYLAARRLTVVRDPTNADLHYRRSRLRHEVMPLLRRERPDLDQALAALCDRLRADAQALDEAAQTALARLRAVDGTLDAAALDGLPEALFVRVVGLAAAVPLGAAHLRALRHLCADRRGTRSLDLPARLVAERRYDCLEFRAREPVVLPSGEVAVGQAGIYLLGERPVEVTAEMMRDLGPGPFTLRHLRAGDRTPTGGKLQDLLVNQKVPRPERARLVVLARGNEVVWIPGLRLTGRSAMQ